MTRISSIVIICLALILVLAGLPAACLAQSDDVLAAGPGPAPSDEQSNIKVPPEHPSPDEKTVTFTEDQPTDRDNWFNWSDSNSIEEVHDDDELKF